MTGAVANEAQNQITSVTARGADDQFDEDRLWEAYKACFKPQSQETMKDET